MNSEQDYSKYFNVHKDEQADRPWSPNYRFPLNIRWPLKEGKNNYSVSLRC